MSDDSRQRAALRKPAGNTLSPPIRSASGGADLRATSLGLQQVAKANTGRAFEAETARRLEQLGWDTRSTPVSGDYGADILATCGTEILVVQCKDWRGAAGFEAVKDVHAARTYYKAEIAAVVARTAFSRQAQEAEKPFTVHLLLLDELVTGCALDRTVEGGIVRLQRRLAEERAAADEKRRKLAEEREQALAEWAAYDARMAEYTAQQAKIAGSFISPRWKRLIVWTVALSLLSGMSTRSGDPATGAVILGAVVGWIHGFVLFTPLDKPEPPRHPRPPR